MNTIILTKNKLSFFLKKQILFFTLLLGVMSANAQFAVTTNGGSGLAPTYVSLAAAITALNGATISSPVIITCPTGTETSPAGGYSITATGTSVNTIVIQGNGAANSIITAPNPAGTSGALNDAIFKIIGGDYITIQGFAMNENSLNTTTTAASNNMVEFGVALLYATTTNGSQNNTIQNNSITLNRTYQNTFGIYSNSTHSATAMTTAATATTTAGGNSNMKVFGNTISNVNNGIIVVGPTAAADYNTGVDIGGTSSSTANTITNYGTTGTFSGYTNVSGTVNGILIRNSIGYNISYNTITSSVGGVTVGTLNGIQSPAFTVASTGTFTNNVNNNIISLKSGLATGGMNGINILGLGASTTSTLNINNNDFNNWGHTIAASGTIICINTTNVPFVSNINNNTFTNLNVNTTGSFTFISHSYTMPAGGSQTINNNSIVTAFNKTGAGGTVTCTTTGASSPNGTFHATTNNNFSNITVTGATTIQGTLNNDGSGTSPQKTFTGNTYSNWTGGTGAITGITYNYIGATTSSLSNNTFSNITGQGAITAISIGNTFAGATTLNIASNTITNLTSTGTGGLVQGIHCTNTSLVININNNSISGLSSTSLTNLNGIQVNGATQTNIFKNTICNLENSGVITTQFVSGIFVTGATPSINVHNNRIADLRAPNANDATALVGIQVNSSGATNAINVYNNSVHLNGMSSGAVFGSSAISASATPILTLNNNVFVNNSSANSTGLSVAYRRSGVITGTNYNSTSDRNDFFASTIFTDGTNTFTAIGPGAGTYKNFVAARDANSISVNPTFLSTTCGNANFLKVSTAAASQLESGGANIDGLTDDFENDIRQGNPGYAAQVNGGGTAPDIGADEFDGIPAPVCNGFPAASTITGAAAVCSNTGTTLGLSTTYTDLGITYQWFSGNTPGGPWPTALGTASTQATGNLSANTYYVCEIICTNTNQTYATAEKSVLVNALPNVSLSPSSATICSPGGAAITLTAGGAISYAYSPSIGLTPTSGSPVSANPSTSQTYTVTGTDANGCVNTATAIINIAPNPAAVTISPSSPTVCSGVTQMLTSSGGPSISGTSNTIGSGTGFTTTTGEQTAFSNRRINYVGQTIYTASELVAAGVVPGSDITSLAYNISSNGDATTNANFVVKVGHVGSTINFPSTSFFSNASYTTVFGPATYTHAAPGFQLITFTNPFVWDGVSNICVDVRHDGIDATNNAQTQFTTTAGNASIYGYNTPATGTLSTSRLNIRLGYSTQATNLVWAPTTNLFTDPGASTGYTGSPSTNVVYFNGTSSSTYTVTSTNAAGCTSSGNVTVTVTPLGCSAATITGSLCSNSNFMVTANHSGGGAPYTYSWSDGSATVYPTTSSVPVNLPAGTYTLTCTVGDACGASCTSSVVVTVNALPSVGVSPSSGLICTPGGSAITLTTSGAATYAWSPTTGLTPTSGSPVSANPSSSTTYTVSGTDANGCVSTSTAVITVSEGISILSGATATPSTICSGANSQLNYLAATTSSYSVQSTPYLFETPTGTPLVIGTTGDDVSSGQSPLPFGFNYFGITYTDFVLYSNGFIQLGTSSGSTSDYGATFPTAAAPNNIIAGVWDDLNITGSGSPTVRSFTNGTAPNRVFILEYNNLKFYNSAANNGNATFQIKLFETSNKIEVHIANVVDPTPSNHFIGIENSGGTLGAAPAARNPFTSDITTPEAWQFQPSGSAITYAWTPSTFIAGQESLSNPLATAINANTTYTVTATTSAGCSSSATTSINVNPIPTATISGTSTICNGGSAVLTLNLGGTGPWLYEINGNLASSTVSTFTVSVNPTTTTTYSITAFADNNCNGTYTGSAVITVDQLSDAPSSISGTSTICNGDNTTLTLVGGTAGTGATAEWFTGSCGGTSAGTGASINVAPTTTTTYFVRYNGTCNTTTCASVTVTVDQPSTSPTSISGTTTICTGENTTLTLVGGTAGTGATAEWFTGSCGGTSAGTGASINVTPTTTTTYFVRYNGTCNTTSCASVTVTVNQPTITSSTLTQCDSYTWPINSLTYTNSGQYVRTYLNSNNCVSSDTLNLTINYSTTSSTTVASCNNYTWFGNTFTASSTYTHTNLNSAGCLNTDTLHLSIVTSTSSSTTIVNCDSYTWFGTTYTTSGIYTHTNSIGAGCLNTDSLLLTINYSSTNGNATISACNSYTWNGTTYTTSGIYTFTSLNASNCVNTATLNLTVNYSTTSSSSATSCNSYVWFGTTYTTSGNYTHTNLNAAGCLNTDNLALIINYSSTTGSMSVTACDSYTWSATGLTYTASGVYTKTTINASGCVNTATLTLTVNYSSTNGNATITACDSYIWNGVTYTTSGIYTFTSLNSSGCINTATLNLTINYSSTNGNATVTACNSYTWNGSTYTTSGVYTFTSLNASGCINTATLNLTVNYSSTNGNASITACDSYTWNGVTYTASGTYSHTSLNASGCVNTAILSLTINASSTVGSLSVSVCDSYTWSATGLTYTTSGVYTHTTLNGVGCVNTATLTLTIIPSTTSSTTISACGAYTWYGITYTASGSYTHVTGCLTETLNLTIITTFTYNDTINSNGCYVWSVNGATYTNSGVYTYTTTNVSTGCAETFNLYLTITQGLKLSLKAALSGPFVTTGVGAGLMHDSLRVKGQIPASEPYSNPPYNKPQIAGAGGESVSPSVMAVTGANAIVDWVFIELRNASTPSIIVATKRALIQRDGDVVSNIDGVSPVFFAGMPNGNYFVSIKHRNHLGVMTLSSILLDDCLIASYDFTTAPVYSIGGPNPPRKLIGSVNALWSADCNNNKNVKYNGLANDKDFILAALGGVANASLNNVYRVEDANMDGKIRYNNTDNDRMLIINNLGVNTPNNIINQHTPN